ncbi:mono/diheme cytochrome c family protein [Rubricella aquisinus]|uniref:Mono/diheme cytochrome c family protein n=1 Tax=Rubricella aquisinus TaxID=2028108 RepID=A0A840WQ30_9RHOB|nr:cytochrome c [Rubricella aquisinus]MBB5517148.1 mono/diheme cytochrome c family protein [Rubricella aquisinus]
MKRHVVYALALSLAAVEGFFLISSADRVRERDMPAAHTPDLAQGEVLFHAGGCASCHARPGAKGDEKLILAGGLALETDFGTFHVPNISPDPEQGIGGWSARQFASAMIEGTSPEREHYYPAFPYTSYRGMSVAQTLDLQAFMMTLPSDDTASLPHDLKFPFGWRRLLGFWKRLYLAEEPVLPVSDDPKILRGQFLVEVMGHCGECHTPRGPLGGMKRDEWLAGGPNPDGEGRIPNITPHPDGIGSWGELEIADYLATGFTPDFDSVGGSMVAVVENMSKLPLDDLEAIAAYLKTVPPLPR